MNKHHHENPVYDSSLSALVLHFDRLFLSSVMN